MLRKLAKLFLVFCWAVGLWLLGGECAIAQESSTSTIDLSRVTFGSLPVFEQPGQIESVTDLQLRDAIGYDPGRSWNSGMRPASVFKVGDFQSSLHAQSLNLGQIGALSGLNVSNLTLSEVPFFQEMSLKDLVDAVPSLEAFTLAEIPGFLDILGADPDSLLGDLVNTEELFGSLNVSDYFGALKISDIPNLSLTGLDSFRNWQNFKISDVPGLQDVPWGSLSDAMAVMSGVVATHDVTYGPKEHRQTPTKFSITGGDQVGFSVQCAQSRGCAYIELEGMGKMHGAQWIAGGRNEGQQMVEGGFGPLAVVNGGEEPTGRHPFGNGFKIVLTTTDEAEGTGKFSLYFNICVMSIYGETCTPYFLGPVPMPLLDSREKGLIITGLLDAQGGSSSGLQVPKSWEDMRPAPDAETQAFIDSVGRPARRGGRGGSLCGEGPGGVDFNLLANVFSSIEGDYDSVGVFDCDRDGNCGRGLGRYQYMTYRSDVRAKIREIAGGDAFLAKADTGASLSRSEVEYFFPPSAQDAIFREDQTRNIEQALSEGFTGTRLIERVGQIHFGGPGAEIDGSATDIHGRLSLKTYGEELAEQYSEQVASNENTRCRASTPVRPLETKLTGVLAAQEYGAARPRRGCHGNCHAGQDIDIEEGEAFQAYIGGEVTFQDCHPSGYFCFIDIYNEGLGVVFRVAEAREILVDIGDTVQPGQVITHGSVTGVIHIEIRTDVDELGRGRYGVQGTIDPIEYLEDLGVLRREGIRLVGIDEHNH